MYYLLFFLQRIIRKSTAVYYFHYLFVFAVFYLRIHNQDYSFYSRKQFRINTSSPNISLSGLSTIQKIIVSILNNYYFKWSSILRTKNNWKSGGVSDTSSTEQTRFAVTWNVYVVLIEPAIMVMILDGRQQDCDPNSRRMLVALFIRKRVWLREEDLLTIHTSHYYTRMNSF